MRRRGRLDVVATPDAGARGRGVRPPSGVPELLDVGEGCFVDGLRPLEVADTAPVESGALGEFRLGQAAGHAALTK